MAATAEVPRHYLNVSVYNIRTTSLVGLATGGHGPADAAHLLPERPPDVAVWVCRRPARGDRILGLDEGRGCVSGYPTSVLVEIAVVDIRRVRLSLRGKEGEVRAFAHTRAPAEGIRT